MKSILHFLLLLLLIVHLKKKQVVNPHELLLRIYSLLYLLFLSFVPIWPRYLLLLSPFTMILFVKEVISALLDYLA